MSLYCSDTITYKCFSIIWLLCAEENVIAATEVPKEELSKPSDICTETANDLVTETAHVEQTTPSAHSISAVDVTVEKKMTSEVSETVTVKGK